MVTTHRHGDHWQALADVVAATRAQTYASREDAPAIPVATDAFLGDGDVLPVGEVTLRVTALRGHTPGSIALLYDDPEGAPHLFTGDSLFPGGPGNTEGDSERFDSLMTDLETRVFARLARRDLGVPRPRQRHHARRRTPLVARVARPRLVSPLR